MSVCKLESYLITRIKVQCCDLYICLSTYVKFAQKKTAIFFSAYFSKCIATHGKMQILLYGNSFFAIKSKNCRTSTILTLIGLKSGFAMEIDLKKGPSTE